MQPLVAFAAGVLFAIGLGISGMTHPSKVLAFLDVRGDWDPSLAFVMGGGVLVNFVVFRLALRRGTPIFARSFSLPAKARVDAPLVLGASVFGIGWGIGGFCPGPAIVSLAGGATPVVAFVAAMLGSMLATDAAERYRRRPSLPGPFPRDAGESQRGELLRRSGFDSGRTRESPR